jgi:hypothetical protein
MLPLQPLIKEKAEANDYCIEFGHPVWEETTIYRRKPEIYAR